MLAPRCHVQHDSAANNQHLVQNLLQEQRRVNVVNQDEIQSLVAELDRVKRLASAAQEARSTEDEHRLTGQEVQKIHHVVFKLCLQLQCVVGLLQNLGEDTVLVVKMHECHIPKMRPSLHFARMLWYVTCSRINNAACICIK